MYLTQLTFGPAACLSLDRDALKDAAESYLASLLKNGQLYGEYLLAWCEDNLVAYTHLPRPDSVAERHHSAWVKKEFDVVVKNFGGPPKCKLIDDDVPKRFPNWKQSASFYLFTHAFDDTSPVCCGDSGKPIPLYLLPLGQELREHIYFWGCAYKQHDHIWLNSAALEIPAYKQLADPMSDLSANGRELCAQVERATGRPTYYFLMRYWGRNIGEAVRRCPSCGGKWHTSETETDRRPFFQFHFCCQRCRLVSHCANSYEDERHARIGEFKKSK